MNRTQRVILGVGVVGLIGLVIVFMATPGSVVTARYASGEPTDRTAIAALVALLTMGFLALGLDFRDWF